MALHYFHNGFAYLSVSLHFPDRLKNQRSEPAFVSELPSLLLKASSASEIASASG